MSSKFSVDSVTNKNDEFYTPKYAVKPLLKYIPNESTILCPFDTESSLIAETLSEHGCSVKTSHIFDGVDFFSLDKPKEDFVISNPPYSLKGEVLQRLFEWGTPFAMLLGVVGLFESQKRFEMFRDNPFEVMYLNRRVSYFKSYNDQKPSLNPPFSSVWLCSGVLPNRLVFEEVQKE
jgi:hypothetical protein